MKLLTAKLITEDERQPDLTLLGYFTNKYPGKEALENKRAFIHKPGDSMTLNFFIPFMTTLDKDDKELLEWQYKRMLAYEQGDWHMVNVHLQVRIEIGGTVQQIVSETVHNVPSDCDCLGEYAEDMLDEIVPAIEELGFSEKDVLELGLEI